MPVPNLDPSYLVQGATPNGVPGIDPDTGLLLTDDQKKKKQGFLSPLQQQLIANAPTGVGSAINLGGSVLGNLLFNAIKGKEDNVKPEVNSNSIISNYLANPNDPQARLAYERNQNQMVY